MVPEIESPRRLPLFALFAAQGISMVGNVLTGIAVPWFVLETTGSATLTGLAAFASALPVVLAAFFGGAIVDRLGFRRTSVAADLASMATVALVPLLHVTVGLPFWALLVLVFLGALLDAPGSTARTALLPDVARAAGWRMERAASAIQVIERGSRLVGAPLAGVLIAVLGAAPVLWIDATTFAVSAALVALAVPAARRVSAEPAARPSYFDDLLSGLRFIRAEPVVLAIVLTVLVTNLMDAPTFAVILPVYAMQTYGSALPLGLMIAANGGGAVLGALAYGAMGHRLSRRWTFAIGFVVAGLLFWVLALLPPLEIAVGAMLLAGIAAGPLNPVIDTVIFARVPQALRGRVLGSLTAGAFLGIPVGMLLGGGLVESLGLRPTLLIIAACYLLTTLSLLVNPALRDMDARASDSA